EVLLVHVLRYVMKHQKIETGVLAGLADIRLARAITAIHSQPEQRWSVQTLANEAGMSRTAFNQYFRETVGCTPGEYLLQWRMRLACRWLETGQVVIGNIVDRLGYQSETAFFRAFRRQIGMSPGQYRDNMTT
ncbi:MAG: AraC family transcriptional regulator, partial [Gammaproteobacteria bacterium]|nr:AraC family transcriptional regulator [Gammaproteobacteria bacterium]